MNHMSSGSSGNKVIVPDPSRSIACFTRRIVVKKGEMVGRFVFECERDFLRWGRRTQFGQIAGRGVVQV